MKKFFSTLALSALVLSNGVVFSQKQDQSEKQSLTAKDAIYYNPAVLPKRLNQLNWIANTDSFSQIENNVIVSARPGQKKNKPLLTLKQYSDAIVKAGGKEQKHFGRIQWVNAKEFVATIAQKIYIVNIKSKAAKEINSYPKEVANLQMAPKTFAVAYTKENNIFISVDGKETQVTKDDSKEIINGETVSRNEFGIDKGIFWSPKEEKLAYYTKDVSKVADYPLVDVNTRIASLKNSKYPMAGESSEKLFVKVYDLQTKKTTVLDTKGPVDQYLTNVTWSPDQKYIYVGLLNRDQNHLKVNKYDAATGSLTKTLFEEKDEKWVEPEFPLYFPNNDASKFIWISERDGFNHLYLYSAEGKLIKQLTHGDWMVTKFLKFDKNNKKAFFLCTKDSPLDMTAYSVDINSSKITKITPHNGTHHVQISDNGRYAIDIYSDTIDARVYNIVNNKGRVVQQLLKDSDPLNEFAIGKTTIGKIKNKEGIDLYYRLIKPANFDASKKYPAIVYVYGGPHAQMITNSWTGGGGLWLNYLANQGYIVFTVDNRGSANRGKEFEQAIHRNIGVPEVEDQITGAKYLKSLPYVDTERIGVDGWSYGGFMTITLLLEHPEIFKVAVAGGPVIDWKYYEIMYGERYMDSPESNPEGYKNANILNKVKDLQGRLMVIHGAIDPVVVWQHSLQLLNQSVKDDKLIDYYVYPNHEHNVRGLDRAHLYKKIVDYFNLHLKK
ncbi:MAG: DPP IV N-terminal domain-containing protein [Bacteroidales bacterium]